MCETACLHRQNVIEFLSKLFNDLRLDRRVLRTSNIVAILAGSITTTTTTTITTTTTFGLIMVDTEPDRFNASHIIER